MVDLVFARPLDAKAVRDHVAACNGRFVVVEDGCVHGGIGSAVLEVLQDMDVPLRFRLLGIPDRFVEHGPVADLRRIIGLDAQGIRTAVGEVL